VELSITTSCGNGGDTACRQALDITLVAHPLAVLADQGLWPLIVSLVGGVTLFKEKKG